MSGLRFFLLCLFFSLSAFANTNELCQVNKVLTTDFDRSLEAFGDETLSFIGFSDLDSDYELTVGGFSFFNDNKTSVSLISNDRSEIVVSLKSKGFGSFEYKSVLRTGCAYISKVLAGNKLKVVAVANCQFETQPNNPSCTADIVNVSQRKK